MNSRLGPTESFPEDLTALDDIDVQVLHSRVQRQLDHEYATACEAHPETESRHAELLEEFTRRTVEASAWRSLLRTIVEENTASTQALHLGTPDVALDPAIFAELVDDLASPTAAFSFITTFESLLDQRISNIQRALEYQDKEAVVTAMLSLQASAAITGAGQLHASITQALKHKPIEKTPHGPLVQQLEAEANLFRKAFADLKDHHLMATQNSL
ncbi:hypothetical protein [Arthrobacter cheniae]|uniref:hypothetical protein n=1 Tax=Arthrobacter cheniae TaxID=1258888 RepID=UPI001602F6F1|nr:hypothetical protein [Arthrobacter cheniae]